MVCRRTLTLTPAQQDQLQDYRDHHPKPAVRERCAALLKVANGQSAHAVARHGLLKRRKPDTLYGWLDYFEAEGVEGLLRHTHGGNRRGCF